MKSNPVHNGRYALPLAVMAHDYSHIVLIKLLYPNILNNNIIDLDEEKLKKIYIRIMENEYISESQKQAFIILLFIIIHEMNMKFQCIKIYM